MVGLAASAVFAKERQKRLIIDKVSERLLGKVSLLQNLICLYSYLRLKKSRPLDEGKQCEFHR